MNNRFLKKYSIYIISSLLVLFFYLIVMIYNGIEPFGTKSFIINDGHIQIYPFLATMRKQLLSGGNLFYSWNGGLGSDFFSTYYYYLASPINFLIVLFPEDKVDLFLSLSIVFRGVFAASTFAFYLSSKYEKKDSIIIAFSVAYAISAFVCAYSFSTCWMDTYVVFPIVMFGYRRMITSKKIGVYVLSLAYMAYCCFYLAFIVGLFLVLVFILDEHKSVKDFFKNCLYFGLASLTAVGMNAVPILVCIYTAVSSGNGEQSITNLSHEWYGNIFEVLRYQFFLSKSVDISFIFNDTNIYCGVFSIITLFLYIYRKDISVIKKVKTVSLLALLILSMNETFLNFIWHGFHTQLGFPNRFSFLFIFMLLEIACDTYVHFDEINKSLFYVGCLCSVIYPLVCYIFVDFNSYVNSHVMIACNMGLIFVYCIILLIKSKLPMKNVFSYILLGVISAEVIVNSFVAYNHNNIELKDHNYQCKELKDAISETESGDESFHRSDIVDSHNIGLNLIEGINGYSVFNTFLSSDLRWTSESLTGFTSTVAVENRGLNNFLEDIFGLKYIYTLKDNYQYDDKYNYRLVYENDYVKSYINEDYLGLGFGVNDLAEDVEMDNSTSFENMNRFAGKVLADAKIYDEKNFEYSITPEECDINFYDADYPAFAIDSKQSNSFINVDFTIDEDGQYYLFSESDQTLEADIIINDKVVRKFHSNFYSGITFIGNCKKDDSVRIKVCNYNRNAAQTDVSSRKYYAMRIAKEDIDSIDRINSELRKNQFDVTGYGFNSFKGKITLENNQSLLTTVPYNKGWTIYENGQKIPSKKYLNTFLGANLPSGEHELEFVYVPQGLIAGIVITVIAWIGFIIYIIVYYKRINKEL